jgi:methyl-accepting chemotaxis protein
VDESEVVTVGRPLLRRRILISTFQYRLLVVNFFYYCAIVLIVAGVLFLPPMWQLRSATSFEESEHVAVAFLFLHARLWPALLLVLGLLAFHSVIVSHRIAGPLYRFERIWTAMAAGDLSVRARLRKSDYLKREAAVMNEMIAALAARISDLDAQIAAVRASFDDVRRAREGGSAETLDRRLQHLGGLLDDLATRMGQFRVAPPAGAGVGTSVGSGTAPVTHG